MPDSESLQDKIDHLYLILAMFDVMVDALQGHVSPEFVELDQTGMVANAVDAHARGMDVSDLILFAKTERQRIQVFLENWERLKGRIR